MDQIKVVFVDRSSEVSQIGRNAIVARNYRNFLRDIHIVGEICTNGNIVGMPQGERKLVVGGACFSNRVY